jgi:hypothetical protein
VVLETPDPEEAVWYVENLAKHPEQEQRIRTGGRETARRFVWDAIIDNLLGKVAFLAARQGAPLKLAGPTVSGAAVLGAEPAEVATTFVVSA